jgi:hypothetical protein
VARELVVVEPHDLSSLLVDDADSPSAPPALDRLVRVEDGVPVLDQEHPQRQPRAQDIRDRQRGGAVHPPAYNGHAAPKTEGAHSWPGFEEKAVYARTHGAGVERERLEGADAAVVRLQVALVLPCVVVVLGHRRQAAGPLVQPGQVERQPARPAFDRLEILRLAARQLCGQVGVQVRAGRQDEQLFQSVPKVLGEAAEVQVPSCLRRGVPVPGGVPGVVVVEAWDRLAEQLGQRASREPARGSPPQRQHRHV